MGLGFLKRTNTQTMIPNFFSTMSIGIRKPKGVWDYEKGRCVRRSFQRPDYLMPNNETGLKNSFNYEL